MHIVLYYCRHRNDLVHICSCVLLNDYVSLDYLYYYNEHTPLEEVHVFLFIMHVDGTRIL